MPLTGFRAFLRRHALSAGFVAVLVPLAVLLSLQSMWLARLERASTMARKAAIDNYLDTLVNEVERHYAAAAERALILPSQMFTEGAFQKAAMHWKKKPVEGVRRFFVVDFTREPFGNYLVFDPNSGILASPPASEETLSMIIAVTPWQMVSYGGAPAESAGFTVDERNPDFRILLNPITDDSSRVVGVAGMLLDTRFFLDELLPSLVRKIGPTFFPDAGRTDLSVCVLEGRGRVLRGQAGHEHESIRRLSFVFADMSLGVDVPERTPRVFERAGYAMNMAVSALLGALLLLALFVALRTASRAMKLSEMKSEFVSNISHELRTPLASIRVFGELLRGGKVQSGEKVREYGEYIESESLRLTRLINNILDFSGIESGRKTYRFARTDLSRVVQASVAAFELRLRHSGFDLSFEPPAEALPPVEVDADAIGQAVHNLLDNAVKYSGESRRIEVRITSKDAGVVLSVRDHGVGIPRFEQQKIFERFHRVSTGLVHDVKGSGLGLSIVHHIVKAHGGRVHVESEPERGSTFFLWLPAAGGEAPHEEPRAANAGTCDDDDDSGGDA